MSELQTGLAQRHIPTINGFRAVAVFLVIFYHAGIGWSPGGLGVTFFFVISGFLITWLLLLEDWKARQVSLKRFYLRRFLRICPAFYAYVLSTVSLLWLLHKHVDNHQLIAALLFINDYYQAIYGDPNTALSHTWSLGVEEQFYLIWPLVFVSFKDRRERLIPIVMCIISGIWIYRIFLKYVVHVWQGYIYEAFDTRVDHLLVGCLLALLLFDRDRQHAWNRHMRSPLVSFALVGVLAVSTLLELIWQDWYRDVWGFVLNPVAFALLIPAAIASRNRPLLRWLDTGTVKYLGTISYSLYLYQQLLLYPITKFLHNYPASIRLIVAVSVLVAVASGSYWLIEKPFLRLKDKLYLRT